MAKKNKIQRIKMDKMNTEEQIEVKNFIKILIIVLVLILGFYFFTRIFVTKDLFNKKNTEEKVTAGEVNYNKTIIGAMLTRKESEYYVMMYSSKDINSVYYSGLISNYERNENALKVYFADLASVLNKDYVTENSNDVNVKDFENFKVKDLALVRVSNGKITKVYTSEEEIAEALKYIKS